MNEKALRVLEYNKIIEMLAGYAGSGLGAEKCRKTLPLTELEEIEKRQNETADAYARILKKGTVSFSGIPDIRGSVKRLEIGSTLGTAELMHISSLLTAVLRVKKYGVIEPEKSSSHQPEWKRQLEAQKAKEAEANSEAEEEKKDTDALTELFESLAPITFLADEINRCILSEDEIADDASAGLKSVRRAMKSANDKIRDQLNSMMTSNDARTMMQDALITMRNGRYCIPVKSEYKSKFPGMVHDQSSSGSTLFIEPMAVVKLNNELRELALKEADEIEKILEDLSGKAASHSAELYENQELLSELDYIFARAQLAKHQRACKPAFNNRRYINIKKGRHPLIDSKKVVPIDIRVGDDFDLLVITGPNTGGKTVSLKTMGLFTMMGQAGLHIPAGDGSELGIFKEVFADIGDEQSIEQSLSTFSSHMTNTVSILENADFESLCLFDELGAGTDPLEGAALAMAILNHLHKRSIRTVATTHYSELKIYALSTEGVSNACCEFDVESLRPTYRLLIGIPGKSNAFAISSKLGLKNEIIEAAKQMIGENDQNFEDVISGLEADRIRMERDKAELTKLRAEAENNAKKWRERQDKLDAARDRVLAEAREKAAEILQEAKDYADESIRKMNKYGSGSIREMEAERTALREKLDKNTEGQAVKKRKKTDSSEKHEFKEGDTVLVVSLNLKGKIVGKPNAKGELPVQMGILRSNVALSDLEWAEEEEEEVVKKTKHGAASIGYAKSMSVSAEINLIGKRVDEALPELDKYLDDAYLAHLEKVSVIHGRGTGALREAVHNHLKRTKYVKSYRLGEFGEGDRGVTIVEFKK